jgi:hypothetical protein
MGKLVIALTLTLLCTACMPSISHTVVESSQALMQPPSREMATVVFVRAGSYLGGLPFALYDGDKIIGVLDSKECVVATVSQGKHLLSSFIKKGALMDGRNRYAFMDAELASGRIYYVLVRPYVIYFAGAFSELEPIREKNDPKEYWKKLSEWLSDCKVTGMTDATLVWGKEMYSDNASEREKDYADWTKDENRPKKAMLIEDGIELPVSLKKK